ncbi:hypothetical protein ED733_008895 [Metarhizium rileyi]|uniref:Uncharacterized protein n=1 Tax=Metarhizium rileyi (strain RCEF 4871) TaxID=1649241 RepID=A0A5C6GNP5_METRR|nr:hypothetical protein ED733_008895 [Metarhizium rileyi]
MGLLASDDGGHAGHHVSIYWLHGTGIASQKSQITDGRSVKWQPLREMMTSGK